MALYPGEKRVHRWWLSLLAAFLWTGCATVEEGDAGTGEAKTDAAAGGDVKEAAAGNAQTPDPATLLSKTYEEAKKSSPRSLEIPPFYKIAADEITVLKTDASGQPIRVRARGKVFMEVDFREQLRALGQEAYIESNGELIVRGKPLLQRGRSIVEGLSDFTVYYIRGLRLQVIGSHRKTTQDAAGTPVVLATWKKSWKEGPNPLLPALSPDDVPRELRASPLLPPMDGADDLPLMLPPAMPSTPSSTSADSEPDPPAGDSKPEADPEPSPETEPKVAKQEDGPKSVPAPAPAPDPASP